MYSIIATQWSGDVHLSIKWPERIYLPEKLLHNWIYYPSNRSKQTRETHTGDSAGTQFTRQSLNEKQHTYVASEIGQQLVCEAYCILFFIQSLPRILWASTISRVNFSDLFGPIVGVTNPIMSSLLRRIQIYQFILIKFDTCMYRTSSRISFKPFLPTCFRYQWQIHSGIEHGHDLGTTKNRWIRNQEILRLFVFI